MNTRTLVPGVLIALIAGCATPPPAPVFGPDSPANADAAEAPLPQSSDTLAIVSAPPPPVADQPTIPMPEMQGMSHHGGMHHGAQEMEGMKGMDEQVPPKAPDENAPLSAPRVTPGTKPATDSAAARYVCPMHPQVTSDKPGKCPKCGMKLVEKNAPGAGAGQGGAHEGHGGAR